MSERAEIVEELANQMGAHGNTDSYPWHQAEAIVRAIEQMRGTPERAEADRKEERAQTNVRLYSLVFPYLKQGALEGYEDMDALIEAVSKDPEKCQRFMDIKVELDKLDALEREEDDVHGAVEAAVIYIKRRLKEAVSGKDQRPEVVTMEDMIIRVRILEAEVAGWRELADKRASDINDLCEKLTTERALRVAAENKGKS